MAWGDYTRPALWREESRIKTKVAGAGRQAGRQAGRLAGGSSCCWPGVSAHIAAPGQAQPEPAKGAGKWRLCYSSWQLSGCACAYSAPRQAQPRRARGGALRQANSKGEGGMREEARCGATNAGTSATPAKCCVAGMPLSARVRQREDQQQLRLADGRKHAALRTACGLEHFAEGSGAGRHFVRIEALHGSGRVRDSKHELNKAGRNLRAWRGGMNLSRA